jgi:hypothetical protein
MTREAAIKRWEDIIPAVFKAEDKLRPQLQQILADHKDDPTTAAELYTRAIAEEIVSQTTDEELSKL